MIQASPSYTLWYPGKKLEGFGAAIQLSARVQAINKSREELLGLLHDLPESEYELSFSDLIEKSAHGNSDSGDLPEEKSNKKIVAAGCKERKKLGRNSSCSVGGSSNGVLLNFYMPSSLTRSLTALRASRGATTSKIVDDCAKRKQKEPVMFGCLSGLWREKRREASRGKKETRKPRTCTLINYCIF